MVVLKEKSKDYKAIMIHCLGPWIHAQNVMAIHLTMLRYFCLDQSGGPSGTLTDNNRFLVMITPSKVDYSEVKAHSGLVRTSCNSWICPYLHCVSVPVHCPSGLHSWQAEGQCWHSLSRTVCARGHSSTHWCLCRRRGSSQPRQWVAFFPQDAQPAAQLRHTWPAG